MRRYYVSAESRRQTPKLVLPSKDFQPFQLSLSLPWYCFVVHEKYDAAPLEKPRIGLRFAATAASHQPCQRRVGGCGLLGADLYVT